MIQPVADPALVACCHGRQSLLGYALWEFSNNGWRMKKDASLNGARPSAPPHEPGSFVGQIRATPSVAQALTAS